VGKGTDLNEPGVIHEHVDSPCASNDVVDETPRLIAISHVAHDDRDVNATFLEVLSCPL